MGKGWDAPWKDSSVPVPNPDASDEQKFQAWCVLWLTECYRCLRPSGIIKVFGATRTNHRLCAAMEDAGFVLPPEHSLEGWGYGCLSEDTEILTQEGWVPYHRAKVGTHVAGFDLKTGRFEWQPVEATFEYPYDRKAFRLVGDGSDHIVSIGHRSVVQRDGEWEFVRAQDLEGTETVPGVQFGVGETVDPQGDGPSLEPQPRGQSAGKPGVVRVESGAQAVRAPREPCPHLAGVAVRVERIHYQGTVWCVRVASGAFVARRNGMAFVTGNSGFPKYLNTSKAIDEFLGFEEERERTGQPVSPEAVEFDGHATALKPGWEPFIVGVKVKKGD